MIRTIKYINTVTNEEVTFDSYPFHYSSITGIDGLDNTLYKVATSGQDGSTVYGSKLADRDITLSVMVRGLEEKELQENRLKMLKLFHPKHKGKLVYQRGEIIRSIEVNVVVAPRFTLNGVSNENMVVILEASDPFWTDAESSVSAISYWQSGFEFILEIPEDEGIEFGTKNEELITDVVNEGDVPVGMIIEFKALGTVVNPSLLNIITREFIKINRTMKVGEIITVDTRFNNKGISSYYQGDTENIINYIDIDSTFLQLEVGSNYLKYDADTNADNLEIEIKFNNAYLGV